MAQRCLEEERLVFGPRRARIAVHRQHPQDARHLEMGVAPVIQGKGVALDLDGQIVRARVARGQAVQKAFARVASGRKIDRALRHRAAIDAKSNPEGGATASRVIGNLRRDRDDAGPRLGKGLNAGLHDRLVLPAGARGNVIHDDLGRILRRQPHPVLPARCLQIGEEVDAAAGLVATCQDEAGLAHGRGEIGRTGRTRGALDGFHDARAIRL